MAEDQANQQSFDHPQNTTRKGMNLWKFISVILIIVLIGVAAYELGKGQFSFLKTMSPAVTPTPTVTQASTSAKINQLPSVTPSLSPVPSKSASRTISAGVKTDVFLPYTINVPVGWIDNHTFESSVDKLVLTKSGYTLSIVEGGGDGGLCIYPGQAPQPMSQVFTSFVGITGTQSQLRRGTSDNINYTVCEQKTSGFGFPTQFGYITYIAPASPDSAILAEMDSMVASIAKK